MLLRTKPSRILSSGVLVMSLALFAAGCGSDEKAVISSSKNANSATSTTPADGDTTTTKKSATKRGEKKQKVEDSLGNSLVGADGAACISSAVIDSNISDAGLDILSTSDPKLDTLSSSDRREVVAVFAQCIKTADFAPLLTESFAKGVNNSTGGTLAFTSDETSCVAQELDSNYPSSGEAIFAFVDAGEDPTVVFDLLRPCMSEPTAIEFLTASFAKGGLTNAECVATSVVAALGVPAVIDGLAADKGTPASDAVSTAASSAAC